MVFHSRGTATNSGMGSGGEGGGWGSGSNRGLVRVSFLKESVSLSC